MRKVSGALLVSALSLTLVTANAQAAGREFCRDYAVAALRQVHVVMETGCRVDADSPRWSTEWNVHFNWCRNVSRDQADDQRDARTHRIRECRGG